MRRFLISIAFLIFSLSLTDATAGVLTKEALIKVFPAPFIIGERDESIPVWPIFKQNGTANDLIAYVFESIDLAPIAGFSGQPINMLIAIDPQGNFLEVKVLSHHEPVFLDGLGEDVMFQFVKQYQGLSIKQNIKIDMGKHGGAKENGHIDGVSKATASVRIMNQSILSSALKVARKKLAFSNAADPDQIATIRNDTVENLSFAKMLDMGLIQHLFLHNSDVEKKFANTLAAGMDSEAKAKPDDTFIDLYLAYVSIPSVGKSLLDSRSWERLNARLEKGDHAILLLSAGRYSILDENFVPGTSPSRLTLQQGGLPVDMRDLNMDLHLKSDMLPAGISTINAFRVISQSGLDPSHPLEFSMLVERARGSFYPERYAQHFDVSLHVPDQFYIAAESDSKNWQSVWRQRWAEIALLGVMLVLLFAVLAKPNRISRHPRAFAIFRTTYLLITLVFIGWYAQGQLSIVNLTSAIQSLMAHNGLGFLLYDPMTVILWLAVVLSLFFWGRGTFCGWLCPFGALQELSAKLARLARLPQIRLHSRHDEKLKWIKYGVLLLILACAFISPHYTDQLVEAEPFKTAITLNFIRYWPYVLYVGLLLIANLFIYKFFCRYLCPLGAGLAVMGKVRALNWLIRRKECGQPCQTCRHRCDYQAIKRNGEINYTDCFQCLDCVVIYESDEKCAPLMLHKKRQVIPIIPATTIPETTS